MKRSERSAFIDFRFSRWLKINFKGEPPSPSRCIQLHRCPNLDFEMTIARRQSHPNLLSLLYPFNRYPFLFSSFNFLIYLLLFQFRHFLYNHWLTCIDRWVVCLSAECFVRWIAASFVSALCFFIPPMVHSLLIGLRYESLLFSIKTCAIMCRSPTGSFVLYWVTSLLLAGWNFLSDLL